MSCRGVHRIHRIPEESTMECCFSPQSTLSNPQGLRCAALSFRGHHRTDCDQPRCIRRRGGFNPTRKYASRCRTSTLAPYVLPQTVTDFRLTVFSPPEPVESCVERADDVRLFFRKPLDAQPIPPGSHNFDRPIMPPIFWT